MPRNWLHLRHMAEIVYSRSRYKHQLLGWGLTARLWTNLNSKINKILCSQHCGRLTGCCIVLSFKRSGYTLLNFEGPKMKTRIKHSTGFSQITHTRGQCMEWTPVLKICIPPHNVIKCVIEWLSIPKIMLRRGRKSQIINNIWPRRRSIMRMETKTKQSPELDTGNCRGFCLPFGTIIAKSSRYATQIEHTQERSCKHGNFKMLHQPWVVIMYI